MAYEQQTPGGDEQPRPEQPAPEGRPSPASSASGTDQAGAADAVKRDAVKKTATKAAKTTKAAKKARKPQPGPAARKAAATPSKAAKTTSKPAETTAASEAETTAASEAETTAASEAETTAASEAETTAASEAEATAASEAETTRATEPSATRSTDAAEAAGRAAVARDHATRARGRAADAQDHADRAQDTATRAKGWFAEATARAAGRSPEPVPASPALVAPPPPGAWMEAAWEALSQADQPPHRLAELAVAELGPRAAAWADWLCRTYPGAPADGIVRLATEQARRHGWTLAAVDAGGPLTAALHLPASAGLKAMLVLRIAAAYGHDPADPARAGDLLTLLGYDDESGSKTGPLAAAWYAVTRLKRRRLTPLSALSALSAVSEQRDSLLRLAHRAARHYRAQKPTTAA
jgi:hypothetical protein